MSDERRQGRCGKGKVESKRIVHPEAAWIWGLGGWLSRGEVGGEGAMGTAISSAVAIPKMRREAGQARPWNAWNYQPKPLSWLSTDLMPHGQYTNATLRTIPSFSFSFSFLESFWLWLASLNPLSLSRTSLPRPPTMAAPLDEGRLPTPTGSRFRHVGAMVAHPFPQPAAVQRWICALFLCMIVLLGLQPRSAWLVVRVVKRE